MRHLPLPLGAGCRYTLGGVGLDGFEVGRRAGAADRDALLVGEPLANSGATSSSMVMPERPLVQLVVARSCRRTSTPLGPEAVYKLNRGPEIWCFYLFVRCRVLDALD